ncbi:MAG: serine protease inhibitor ecotin [Brachymonas sp.]|nr:serine protease inhibitor ecotin [Brachymonas sp.]
MMLRTSFLTASALLALCSGCALASGSSGTASSQASAASTASSTGSSPAANAALQETLKPFPAAKVGQTRWVIQLPPQNKEADWRVEIIPGQQMQVDCNHRSLGGKLHTRTLKGWGYDYYEFESKGQVASTLMGCPPGSQRQAFVASESLMLRYNSRLPLVVYTDKAYQVQYRIWRAEAPQAAQAQ